MASLTDDDQRFVGGPLPAWARWTRSERYSVGIEEEVMLLDPESWSLADRADAVLATASGRLAGHLSRETHGAALELATAPFATVDRAADDAVALRAALTEELGAHGLRAAGAGTHPTAVWTDTGISGGARYRGIHENMRALARREPTFALHVHVGVESGNTAIRLLNRLRGHLPLLLALSANSPFWQGRDSGLASMRTPLFGAFPRVGIPRAFRSYRDYVATVDALIVCGAFPESTHLWWDVRPQPRLGTVEVRVMDAQSDVARTAVLAALVQTLARLELEEGWLDPVALAAQEALAENRFLAARDGLAAEFLDVAAGARVSCDALLARLLPALAPHADDLGTAWALDALQAPALDDPAWQRTIAAERGLGGLVEALSHRFAA